MRTALSVCCMIGLGFLAIPNKVSARFCEGGHRCSAPKECCLQGCCYLYTPPGPPRAPAPSGDHVLSLFFVNHWYFWCVVAALVLALLCACSLWRRRRTLCGWRDWSSSGRDDRASEPDSAGSCYPPPQYSRCSSFHHAPPPYTEVTSKPDLYPLVFSYSGEAGSKGGASYLMVQYFRNYIVRPAGSLSATSTIDSLSSSFICNANEANTLVPPPYSSTASPDRASPGAPIPRSASSLICRESPRGSASIRHSGSTQFQVPSKNQHNHLNNNRQNYDTDTQNNSNTNSNIYVENTINNQNSENVSNYSLQNGNQNGSVNGNINYSNHAIYDSCGSIGGSIDESAISIQTQDGDSRNIDELRRSLDTCCQILQQRQIPCTQTNSTITNSVPPECSTRLATRILSSFDSREFGTQPNFQDLQRSFSIANSTTGSDVSSLANVGTPDSPPRATSPTVEVRELLDKIRQLQEEPILCTTAPSSLVSATTKQTQPSIAVPVPVPVPVPTTSSASQERPSTFTQLRRKRYFNKSAKTLYMPLNNGGTKSSLKSPVAIFGNRGRRGWVSRSAPTTPSTAPLTDRLTDGSPLLAEHDEETGQDEVL